MPKTTHPVIKQVTSLLRPMNKARTGKRIALFLKDKGITGIQGDPTRDAIALYLQKNGVHAVTKGKNLVVPHKDGTWKQGTQGFFIPLPGNIEKFLGMFHEGKFPSITAP